MFYRAIIWIWSALVVAACVALVSGIVTLYPGAALWVNIAGAVVLMAIAIGFGLRRRWAVYAAIPVVVGTTVVDVLLGLHGGIAVAWPGILLGLVGWVALVGQYSLGKASA